MSRDDLSPSSSQRPGFPVYGPDQLPKTNTMRSDKTQPDLMGVPILRDGNVMLCTADEIGNKPASCSTCSNLNDSETTCMLMGPDIVVANVRGDDEYKNQIEYWPCCSAHNYGEPNPDKAVYVEPYKTPDTLGLIWINAPEVGLEYGGANCSGCNGGDDCDNYQVTRGEKWEAETGFCRVLQHEVSGGQVCSAWHDDDELSWQDAQQNLRGSQSESGKKQLAKDIIGRDK